MRPPSQDRRNYWSEQHHGLLIAMAMNILRFHPQLADGTDDNIDELVNHGWLMALRRRRPDELHGCGSIVYRHMLNYLLSRRYGCSRYYVPVARRIGHLSIDAVGPDLWERIDAAETWHDTYVEDRDELEWTKATVPQLINRVPNHRWRQVLYMRYVQGLPGPEVGRRLGISDTAVYRHEGHAISALRKACGVESIKETTDTRIAP